MKKFSLFCIILLTCTPLFAQDKPKPLEPQAQVDLFFKGLVEGRVDAAYDGLLAGTKIGEAAKDVAMLKEKTREAIRVFGDMSGAEKIDVRNVGTRLQKITSLSLGKRFPIRWRFYFYKAEENWQLIDIRIDDRLGDMFEEAAPVPAK